MNNTQANLLGITVLRLSLGVVLIAHSLYLKLMVFTLAGTAQFFTSLGLPGFMAYATFAVELLAGVALVLGFQTRWAALAVVPVLLGATWAHLDAGWLFTNQGGGWEYPLFLTLVAIAQFLLGDGAYTIKRSSEVPGIFATA